MPRHPLARSHAAATLGLYAAAAIANADIAGCTPTPAKPERATAEASSDVVTPARGSELPSRVGPAAEPAPPAVAPEEASQSRVRRWQFDADRRGALPPGWSAPTGAWSVATSDGAPSGTQALLQTAANASPVFNVALLDGTTYTDVDITVQLHAIKGRIDQGGGVAWRAKDGKNYYVARYNPLEDNYRVYCVRNGRRRQLGTAEVKLDRDAWHALRIRMVGDHIEGFLDGDKHLDVRDTTFPDAGKVGLWTKADAHTAFDALQVEDLER